MDDIKEKLIEVLCKKLSRSSAGYLADYLISNGVTIQQWISVEERLPSLNTRVLVYRGGYFSLSEIYAFGLDGEPVWDYTGLGGDPLFWMPLPEGPEGGAGNG